MAVSHLALHFATASAMLFAHVGKFRTCFFTDLKNRSEETRTFSLHCLALFLLCNSVIPAQGEQTVPGKLFQQGAAAMGDLPAHTLMNESFFGMPRFPQRASIVAEVPTPKRSPPKRKSTALIKDHPFPFSFFSNGWHTSR